MFLLIVLASVGFGIQETLRNDILSQEEITKIELYGDETLSERIENISRALIM
jgi:hypothetical protein